MASWAVSCILNTTYMYVYTQDIYILDFCGKKSLIFLGIYVAPSLNVVVQKVHCPNEMATRKTNLQGGVCSGYTQSKEKAAF